MCRYNRTFLILSLASIAMPAHAAPRLPAVFTDGMVLQSGQHNAIWGWADVDETVTITIGDATATAIANTEGKWRTDLPSSP